MRFPILLAFLLFSFHLFSQQNKIDLKFSPLSLFDEPSFATIQPGVEFKLSKRLSWYNEIGIGYKKGYYEKTDTPYFSSLTRYKIKTELRYYCKPPWKIKRVLHGHGMEGVYFAINVNYIKDQHNTEVSYFSQGDGSKAKTDDFGVEKYAGGFNIVIGDQFIFIGERFMLDMYVGLGPRWRYVKTLNKEFVDQKDQLIIPIDVNINGIRDQIDTKAGSGIVPNFTCGVRICYRL